MSELQDVLLGLSRLIDDVLASRMGWMQVTFANRLNPGKRTRCMDYMIGLTLNLHIVTCTKEVCQMVRAQG